MVFLISQFKATLCFWWKGSCCFFRMYWYLRTRGEKRANWCFCVLKLAWGWRRLIKVGSRSNLHPVNRKLVFWNSLPRGDALSLCDSISLFHSGIATQDLVGCRCLPRVTVCIHVACQTPKHEETTEGLDPAGYEMPSSSLDLNRVAGRRSPQGSKVGEYLDEFWEEQRSDRSSLVPYSHEGGKH